MNKKNNRWLKWPAILLGVLVIGGVAGGWVWRQQAQAESALPSNQIAQAFIGDLATQISASGQLLPQRSVRLSLDMAGRVKAVSVRVGDEVRAGDVLVQLETDALERSVRTAEQSLIIQEANLAQLRQPPTPEEIAAAEAAVASAQAQLDDLLAGPSQAEINQAQAALESARAALRAATARYAALDDQLVVAQKEVDNAKSSLGFAQYRYDAVVNNWQTADYAPYSPQAEQLENAKVNYNVAVANYNLKKADINDSSLRSAQAQVAQAEASLASLTKPKTTQIASARSQLAQAQSNLAKLLAGTNDDKIAVAEAQVEQARISLQEAQAKLVKATLVAPFDGVITAVNLAEGEWASGLAVEMVDMGSLEVVLDVDEVDIGAISMGQAAQITLEAWPGQPLDGQVVAIAPQARSSGGLTTYQVRLSVQAGNLPIRAGMTANAELVTAQREHVLLAPNRAIIADRQAGKYYVNLLAGDQVVRVEISVGLRDKDHTEILSGLQDGDNLVVGEVQSKLDLSNGPQGLMRGLR